MDNVASRILLAYVYILALEALQALTVEEEPDIYSTPAQLGGDLVTLTLLPRSRWQTLLNLEVIQVCSNHLALLAQLNKLMVLATQQTKGATKASRKSAILPTDLARS